MSKPTPQAELLVWYAAIGRDLPWRRTRDPYRILVSEVMLQQTQVARVIPYYERFLTQYPDERVLAQAETEDLHRLWKGLGYPNRVERLRACAQAVLTRGGWPTTPEALQELPPELLGGFAVCQRFGGQGIALEHQGGEAIAAPALAAQQLARAGRVLPLAAQQQQVGLPAPHRIGREPAQELQAGRGDVGVRCWELVQQGPTADQCSAAAQAGEGQQQGEASQGQ